MPTSEELEIRYQLLPSTKLLSFIENPTDYTPLALEVAENELTKRGLPIESLEEAKSKGAFSQAVVNGMAQEPLPNKFKWLYFFGAPLGFTPLFFFVGSYWAKRGFKKRSKESLIYMGLGLIFWSLILFLLWQLDILYLPTPWGAEGVNV